MSYYKDDFKDFREKKIRVRWDKITWENHLKKHPELVDFKNTSKIIIEALEKPSLVIAGCCKKETGAGEEYIFCYYKEHSRYQQTISYTKVVIGCNGQNHYVKTVWKKSALNHLVVQETKYNHFKEIWKDPKSYL